MQPRATRFTSLLALPLVIAACSSSSTTTTMPTLSPQAAVDELLAADRAFSAASAKTDLIAGLSPMFAPDVTMPYPPGNFANNRAEAIAALRANPDNESSTLEWTPVRGGISADGQHGFTYGYMTLKLPNGSTMPLKYLSYWVKRPEGWRVAVYRRTRRPEGTVAVEQMAPSLPARLVAPTSDASTIAGLVESLKEAEASFSRDAQTIGLGPAFARYGRADAMNMGGPDSPGFIIGADAIARGVTGGDMGDSSPVSWGADRAIVASSGDLGVTIGTIKLNTPPANGTPARPIPFFTIWRRDSPSDPWRYVAE